MKDLPNEDVIRSCLETTSIWDMMLMKTDLNDNDEGIINILIEELESIHNEFSNLIRNCLTTKDSDISSGIRFSDSIVRILNLESRGPWYIKSNISNDYLEIIGDSHSLITSNNNNNNNLRDSNEIKNEENAKESKDSLESRTCSKCMKVFSTTRYVEKHKRSCGINERVRYSNMPCPYCGVPFDLFFTFKRHLESCSAKVTDESNTLCNKCFVLIESESRKTHRCKPFFVCIKCPFSTHGYEVYRTHYLSVHLNRKTSIQCDICGKTFGSGGDLRKHYVSHTKEQRFVCSECGKGFGRSDSLKRHMSIHFRQDLPCPYCGKIFSNSILLRRHKSTMHPGYGDQVPCPHCSQGFEKHVDLMRHVKRKHRHEIQSCFYCHIEFPCKMSYEQHYDNCKRESKSKIK